jgi:hypothetical protein
MSELLNNLNPLLDRLRIPGATYRLPSRGIFYDSGELDETVKKGEVEIYPMTAMEEIILATPDKLISGKAITEVFAHCIPQIKKPADLLTKDVDFLMVCLRAVSFGDFMELSYTHDCKNAKDHTYSVDLQQMIRDTKSIDPTTISEEYNVTLPNGQIVTLKPLTYGNVVDLYQTTAMMKEDELSQSEAEELVISTLVNVIRRVDEIEDKEMIREWVKRIPLGWKKQLEHAAQQVSQWGVDFISRHKCRDCGQSLEIPVTANPVSFFI